MPALLLPQLTCLQWTCRQNYRCDFRSNACSRHFCALRISPLVHSDCALWIATGHANGAGAGEGGDTSRTFPPAQAPTRPRSSRRRAAAAAASHTAGAAPTHPVLLPATLAPSPHVHWRASPLLAQSLTTPPTALTGPVALPHVQPQRSSQRTQPPGSGLAPSSYR